MNHFFDQHALNILAFAWFLLCFRGYSFYASKQAKKTACLASELHQARYEWMYELCQREVRVADNTGIANLERSVSFFASTTMLILAGLMTILGSTEKAIDLIADLPLAIQSSRAEWELKLIILIFVFVYAFFKFTWSLRQYGFVTVMVGGVPTLAADDPRIKVEAQRMAKMGSMAAHNFNMGLRTYYFAIAVLSWIIHPLLFIASTALVVIVLYRREFKSSTLKTLMRSSY